MPSVVAPGPEPADHAQPRRDRLTQQRGLAAGDERFLVQRHPQVRRIRLERFAEEARRRHSRDGEGLALDDQGGAERWRRSAAVHALPGVVGEHDHGSRRGCVVLGREDAPGKRVDAEGLEVVAGDVGGAQRPRRAVHALPADAQSIAACLERGERLELRHLGAEALEERIREHPPAILGSALDAAVVAVANPVQAGRVARPAANAASRHGSA